MTAEDAAARPVASAPDDDADREAVQLREGMTQLPCLHRVGTASSSTHRPQWQRLWQRRVAIAVSHHGCRDHWANERTALSYIRTAQAFAITGVIIAQLMRLTTNGNPNPHFGYHKVSVPLASACHIIAILVVLVGCVRFFHWQDAMASGYAISSGWELHFLFALTLLTMVTLFVLCLAIAIERSMG